MSPFGDKYLAGWSTLRAGVFRLVIILRQMARLRRAFQKRVLARLAAFIALAVLLSSVGFWYFERHTQGEEELGYLDALWWSLVTMTTVGYGDYFPRTMAGRFFVALPVMLIGGAILGYAVSVITTFLMESKSRELRGMTKLDAENHIVIVNYPGEAKVVDLVEELRHGRAKEREIVLLTDQIEMHPSPLIDRHVSFVYGSPINQDALVRAAVHKADDAIILSRNESDESSDSHNLGIIIALRARNPDLNMVVECVAPEHQRLMIDAGAREVVCVTELDVQLLSQAAEGLPIQAFVADLVSSRTRQRVDLVRLVNRRPNMLFGELMVEAAQKEMILVGVLRGDTPLINPGQDFEIGEEDKLLVVSADRPREFKLAPRA
jgi:voltage-gated potassium channel